jgi:hypothetical protein
MEQSEQDRVRAIAERCRRVQLELDALGVGRGSPIGRAERVRQALLLAGNAAGRLYKAAHAHRPGLCDQRVREARLLLERAEAELSAAEGGEVRR